MAFIAFDTIGGEVMGVVRQHSDPAHEVAEFAILARSDPTGHGLGWALISPAPSGHVSTVWCGAGRGRSALAREISESSF